MSVHPCVVRRGASVTRRTRSRAEKSVQRDDVELADALVVAGDVDGDDAVVAQREPHDAANLTAGRPDERGDTVDDREARAARTTRQRVGDRLGAAHLAE